MKKAAEITAIVLENGTATVSYASGTTRRYAEDKLPKTAIAWLEAHQETVADTNDTIADTADATDTEPAQLPAVVEAVTAIEVVENEASEECRKDSEEFGNSEEFEAVRAAATMVASAVKTAVAAIRTAAPVAVKAIAWTAGKMVDLYYWLTTYCPIAARWLAIHLAWFIQDAIPVATGAARKAGATARVAGRGFAHGAAVVAGWALVAALATVSTAIKTAKLVVEGWKLREELIQGDMAA